MALVKSLTDVNFTTSVKLLTGLDLTCGLLGSEAHFMIKSIGLDLS